MDAPDPSHRSQEGESGGSQSLPARRRRRGRGYRENREFRQENSRSQPRSGVPRHRASKYWFPIDPWRVADTLVARIGWIILLAIGVFVLAFNWAYAVRDFSATIKLTRNGALEAATTSKDSELLIAREESLQSILEFLRSPEVLQRASRGLGGGMTAEEVAVRTSASALGPNDPITLSARAGTSLECVRLAQAYAKAAIDVGTDLRRDELKELKTQVENKLAHTVRDLRDANRQLLESSATPEALRGDGGTLALLKERAELEGRNEGLRLELATIDLQVARLVNEITKQYPPLVKAKDDLEKALLRYTDEHPKVKELRSLVATLRTAVTKSLEKTVES